jgi:virginiamycin B lyase
MISTLVLFLALCGFFIAPNSIGYDYVYGQGFNQRQHFHSNGINSEHQKDSSIHLVDMPLNLTVLDKGGDKNGNSINRSKSSNLTSDSSSVITTSILQDEFTKGFCGSNSTSTEYSEYVLEYVLPQACEMPLGIAVDDEDGQVWYVSTKRGILGMYDFSENKFKQYAIPQWYVRESARGFSQVWDMKIDDDNDESNEIWFTDTAQNAIWRFKESTKQFEIYRIPAQSEAFGTVYPITMDIVPSESANKDNNNGKNEDKDEKDDVKSIYFIGTFVPSLWYAEIADLRNDTSDGIHEIKLPIGHGFRKIDPFYVTSGSFDFDEDRNSVWISMLSYSRKGQILEYDLDNKSFNIFDLPDDLSSPLGIVRRDGNLDNNNNRDDASTELWLTNPGASVFYSYEIAEQESKEIDDENIQTNANEEGDGNTIYEVDIERYTTSMASPRIFGGPFYENANSNETKGNYGDDNALRNEYYTLPSWIKKASDGSIWFNQQQGNKIARFDPSEQKLVEYWIPSQNNEWGNCEKEKDGGRDGQNSIGEGNNDRIKNCGIANVLSFALMENDDKLEEDRDEDSKNTVEEVWFTEWSTNKIGKIDVSKELPFDIEISESDRDLTVKRGESEKIRMILTTDQKGNENEGKVVQFSDLPELDDFITMTVAGTFTSTGFLGNSSGYFDQPLISLTKNEDDDNDDDDYVFKQEVSFVYTPSGNMIPGDYTLMLGAEDRSVSILKVVKIHVI